MEIRPTKLIKGQGLAKILSESNCQAFKIKLSMVANEEPGRANEQRGIETATQKTHMKYLLSAWYKEIVEYLLNLRCPPSFNKSKYRTLRIKSQNFIIVNCRLYWRDPSGILILCLMKNVEEMMVEFHEGICGGHYR